MSDLDHMARAVEERLALNAMYHATRSQLPVGEIVEHQGAEPFSGDLVDRLRPGWLAASRWAHFFLNDDPRCLEDLGRGDEDLELYEVEPADRTLGPLNWAWLSDTSSMPPYSRADRERVFKYWAGVPRPDAPCTREWLTEKVRVKEHLGRLGEYLERSR